MKLTIDIAKQIVEDGGRYQGALIITETEPKMRKTGNPLSGRKVIKRSSKRVGVNGNYANMVNNQRQRELDALNEQRRAEGLAELTVKEFKPKTSWHTPVFDSFNGSIVCNKKDIAKPVEKRKLYLKHVVTGDTQTQYFIDGKPATEDEIATIKEYTQKSGGGKHQGVENPIIINAVAFNNIKEIHANGNVLKFD